MNFVIPNEKVQLLLNIRLSFHTVLYLKISLVEVSVKIKVTSGDFDKDTKSFPINLRLIYSSCVIFVRLIERNSKRFLEDSTLSSGKSSF